MGRIALMAALAALCLFPEASLATFSGRDGRLGAVYAVSREATCGPHTCDLVGEHLFTMTTLGRDRRLVDDCENCGISRLAWSPTGRRIAWSRAAGSIFLSLAAGGPVTQVPGIEGSGPVWRQDNSGLAFTTAGKVAIMDSSEAVVKLADGSNPTWCRGGTIAFVAYDHWLMSMRPDGTRLRRLPRSLGAGAPDCSPDGRSVLFQTGHHLYVAPVDGGGAAHRIPAPARADTPVWSPSGRRIAWSDGRDIWIARRDGSHARKVTRSRHRGAWLLPSWQPLPRP
jgi:Tol biopolymer transport system component